MDELRYCDHASCIEFAAPGRRCEACGDRVCANSRCGVRKACLVCQCTIHCDNARCAGFYKDPDSDDVLCESCGREDEDECVYVLPQHKVWQMYGECRLCDGLLCDDCLKPHGRSMRDYAEERVRLCGVCLPQRAAKRRCVGSKH